MINQSNQQADKQQHADGGEGAHTHTHTNPQRAQTHCFSFCRDLWVNKTSGTTFLCYSIFQCDKYGIITLLRHIQGEKKKNFYIIIKLQLSDNRQTPAINYSKCPQTTFLHLSHMKSVGFTPSKVFMFNDSENWTRVSFYVLKIKRKTNLLQYKIWTSCLCLQSAGFRNPIFRRRIVGNCRELFL